MKGSSRRDASWKSYLAAGKIATGARKRAVGTPLIFHCSLLSMLSLFHFVCLFSFVFDKLALFGIRAPLTFIWLELHAPKFLSLANLSHSSPIWCVFLSSKPPSQILHCAKSIEAHCTGVVYVVNFCVCFFFVRREICVRYLR